MGPVNCAVVGCKNNTRRLDKWKKQPCQMHNGILQKFCGCEAPFRLYCFPGSVRYMEKRKKWIQLVRRENTEEKSEWKPATSDRVCSTHFVDGIPTVANPDPSLQLGYRATYLSVVINEKQSKRSKETKSCRKKLKQIEAPCFPTSSDKDFSDEMTDILQPLNIYTPTSSDHTYCFTSGYENCLTSIDRDIVNSLTDIINTARKRKAFSA